MDSFIEKVITSATPVAAINWMLEHPVATISSAVLGTGIGNAANDLLDRYRGRGDYAPKSPPKKSYLNLRMPYTRINPWSRGRFNFSPAFANARSTYRSFKRLTRPPRRRFPRKTRRRTGRRRLTRMRMRFKAKSMMNRIKFPSSLVRKFVSSGYSDISIGLRTRASFDSMSENDLISCGPYMQYLDPVNGMVDFNPFSTFSSGTSNYRIQFRFSYVVMIRSKGQLPIHCVMSRYMTTSDHNYARTAMEDNWLAMQSQLYGSAFPTSATSTERMLKFKDSDKYATEYWKLTGRKKKVIPPAGSMTMKMSTPWTTYAMSNSADNANTYQQQLASQQVCLDLHGHYGYCGTVATEVGYLQGAITYYVYKTIQIRYDGNHDTKLTLFGGDSGFVTTWTSSAFTPLQPVVDNQGYTVT